jgi:hypothetical protein
MTCVLKGFVHLLVILFISLLFLTTASAQSGLSIEETDEDWNFKLSFPPNAEFRLPSGVSCDSVTGQEPPKGTGSIPVNMFFPSHVLGFPGFTTRLFQLRTAYARKEELQKLHFVDQEFDMRYAVVTDGLVQEEPVGAKINVSVPLALPCGEYVAIFIMIDIQTGASLGQSEEIQITVKASPHKFDFCYLVQAPTFFDTGHLTQANASLAMVLQWKKEQPQPNSIFLPNSTWNQGRNALFAAARQYHCRYYIFVDEDAELVHREWDSDGHYLLHPEQLGDTWREFERLLLTWQPAVAVPHAQWHHTNNEHNSVAETIALYDHMILALSSSAVDCILPYEVRWDLDALDYSVIPSYIIGHMLFPDHVMQFKSLSAINKVTHLLLPSVLTNHSRLLYSSFSLNISLIVCIQDSRNWPRDILSFMRPLMWTIGAFRPRAQLLSLLSTWFYSHPKLSSFRPFINKTLESPSELQFSGTSMSSNKCNVRLSGDSIPYEHLRFGF